MQSCVDQDIQLWPALEMFAESQAKENDKLCTEISALMQKPDTIAYFFFTTTRYRFIERF